MVKDSRPGKGGAVRPPVIDLKASEVENGKKTPPGASDASAEKARSDAEKPDAGGKDAVRKDGASAESSRKDGPSPKKGKGKSGKKDSGSSKPGTVSTKEETADTPKPAGREDRLPPQPRKGAKGALLVATVTGLAALGGGGYWLYQNFGRDLLTASDRMESRIQEVAGKLSGAVEQTRGETARLAERLDALERRMGELRTENAKLRDELATGSAEQALKDIAQLRTRIDGLEQTVRADSATLKDVRNRLADLSARFKALSDALEKASASGTATPAAGMASASLKLEEMRQETAREIAALKKSMEELRASVETRLREVAVGGDALADLTPRMEKLEKALARTATTAKTAIEKAEEAAKRAQAAAATAEEVRSNPPKPVISPPPAGVAFAELRRKIANGEPFAEELKRLEPLVPGAPGLDTLAEVAQEGAPTMESLSARLATLKAQYVAQRRKALEEQRRKGLVEGLKARLSKVVKVRKADEADWPAALEKAEEALPGSLAAAVAVLEKQPGTPPEDVAAWIRSAKARLAVDRVMKRLGDHVFRIIAQSAGSTGGKATE